MNPTCPYCGVESKLVTGEAIYPHRPDLYSKKFYHCKPCYAYVGCHGKTNKPLGRLANAEFRKAKSMAHKFFDPMWREGFWGKRGDAYKKLAKLLHINPINCHIGMFDVTMCKRVVKEVLSNK